MSKEMVSVTLTLSKELLKEILGTQGYRPVCTNTTHHGKSMPKEKKNLDCVGLPKLKHGRNKRNKDEVLLQKKKILEHFYKCIQKGYTVGESVALTGYSSSTIDRWEIDLNRRQKVAEVLKNGSVKRKGIKA